MAWDLSECRSISEVIFISILLEQATIAQRRVECEANLEPNSTLAVKDLLI